ncbi:hypothetical protein VE00_10527 [Pseudogymnoascus sp. WSF 3629]|nr:hypothetical protein VE00_10527 [Pseudogymnoascus sp. WSF 3629]
MLYSTLSSLLFAAVTSAAAISSVSGGSQAKRNGYVGCYDVHNKPDWMKKDVFSSGFDKVCADFRGVVIGPGSDLKVSVGNLKLEDGRDAFFVGDLSAQGIIENTGEFAYTVDYDYCRQRMATIRDSCSGKNDDTYGGEWHDTIWVKADTNAA